MNRPATVLFIAGILAAISPEIILPEIWIIGGHLVGSGPVHPVIGAIIAGPSAAVIGRYLLPRFLSDDQLSFVALARACFGGLISGIAAVGLGTLATSIVLVFPVLVPELALMVFYAAYLQFGLSAMIFGCLAAVLVQAARPVLQERISA